NGFRVNVECEDDRLERLRFRKEVQDKKGRIAIFDDFCEEINKGRIMPSPYIPKGKIPLTTIPKDETKWRIIRNCSWPNDESSLNALIKSKYKKVLYPTFEELCNLVRRAPNGYMFKVDLREDWKLLGYRWCGQYLVDTRLPFGIASGCQIAQNLSRCVVAATNYKLPMHLRDQHYIECYLDDFFGCARTKEDCQTLFDALCGTLEE
ncbi:hypothetical protein RFI_28525, partial [Reticulomyxa filosa]